MNYSAKLEAAYDNGNEFFSAKILDVVFVIVTLWNNEVLAAVQATVRK